MVTGLVRSKTLVGEHKILTPAQKLLVSVLIFTVYVTDGEAFLASVLVFS